MEFLFFGIDVSKDTLDYATCSLEEKTIVLEGNTSNTTKGIAKMIKLIKNLQTEQRVWVCFEHTGHYSLLLAHLLQCHEIKFSMVNSLEIIRSSGMTRGKTDAVDARRIAIYAATFYHKIVPSTLPGERILRIKVLLTIRDQHVRIGTQLKNALKATEINAVVIDLKQELRDYRKQIKNIDLQIKKIEKRIKECILESDELKQTYNKAIAVTGVGPITASTMIVFTNNFTAFKDHRKFACYCGLAPFEHSSGSSVKRRSRTSRYRNKTMKKLLFQAASTAIQHDLQLKTYYKRKIAEGKHRLSVKNAVACKLVSRVFAVVNRKEPFVKLAA